MKIWYDFETLYDKTSYTLRKLTPIEYILDPRFEALVCSFVREDGTAVCVDGPDLPAYLDTIDWANTTAISHNALFDALILAFRYGIRPAGYGCSMSMAQNWIVHQTGSVSLASCVKRYGQSAKWTTVDRLNGVNWHQLSNDPVLLAETRAYAIDDAQKCKFLYETFMAEGFPPGELDVIDWTIRMAAQPQLEIDGMIVAEHLGAIIVRKQELLDKAGLDSRDNLMKDEALAAALMIHGVSPVPRKVSAKTGKEHWAFAKTDKDFTALLDHENPDVQALVAARLGHKSTGEQTRAERFLAVSRLTNAMPVPLKDSGAHTHRFSGGWHLNMQNLQNGSKLRKALKAPEGYVVVSVDASQIEARLNATLSGETWLVDAFREGRDVYAEFAGLIYGRHIMKQLDPIERFVGKTAILSLGYGSSWPVFQNMVRVKGDHQLNDQMAAQAVNLYRAKCRMIVEHWKAADRTILPMLSAPMPTSYQWGALRVERNKLVLPNGNALRYHNLTYEYDQEESRMQWTYTRSNGVDRDGNDRDRKIKIYGAKLVENECQSLAFVHISEVAMRVMKMTEGLLWPAHQVHDELIYVVPEALAEQVVSLVVAEMSTPPRWLLNAPLAAEGHIGASYGDAK
jgi:DNA polymerase